MSIAIAVTAIDTLRYGCFTESMEPATQSHDRLLVALIELEDAAKTNAERSRLIQRRAARLRKRIETGDSVAELVRAENQPRMVELLTTNMATLETAGAEFRAAEALALRAEGLTIEAIAGLFGVTRQRISALLKQKAALPS